MRPVWSRLIGNGGWALCSAFLLLLAFAILDDSGVRSQLSAITEDIGSPEPVLAVGQYRPTGGNLATGTNAAAGADSIQSWRGTLGNDNNVWITARTTSGLNKLLTFDGVALQGGNKIIISVDDSNVTTGNAYSHLICDWVSATDVFLPADAVCTGGGWRHLHPLRTDNTNTTDTLRTYEIYDGYFWTTGNVAVPTPVSNFISSTGQVLLRTHSTVNSVVQHRTDWAQVEVAIDPVYEPANFTPITTGTITNGVRHLIGAPVTTLNPNDSVRMTIPMSAVSTAIDGYFSFENIKTYEGMNSVLISPDMCVSNAALNFAFYIYNFTATEWERGTATTTGSVCGTDTDYVFAINESVISGFDIDNYLNEGELRIRLLTNAPGVVYNVQLDRLYMMVGSVNADTSKCEISWGTGTASNCSRTRSIGEAAGGTPTASTWQITSAVEYVAGQHALDNDDDTTNNEHAFSGNITFPVTLPEQTTVTAMHYAVKKRSATTTMTIDPVLRNYGSMTNTGGVGGAGGGWFTTPSTDTNAATTYSYNDSWRATELQNDAAKYVHTGRDEMNMRVRTSASTNIAGAVTMDWAFAMMSVRWLETPRHTTVTSVHSPTGGDLRVGTDVTQTFNNLNTWRGALGNDGNFWTSARTTNGLSRLLYFDGVDLLGANKMIISIEDTNVTTATNYENLICDWVSSVGVYLPADSDCPGGWRRLQPRGGLFTDTVERLRQYEIYNGYFWATSTNNTVFETPLTNFISTSTQRVTIRTFSNVNSAVQLRTDWAQVEVAVDPIYEPAQIISTSESLITGGVREIIGAQAIGVNSSDSNRMVIPNPVVNSAMDTQFIFKNIKWYDGANTIVLLPEMCASSAGLTFSWYILNPQTDTWVQATATTTPTTCTTDTNYAFSINDVTVPGFTIDDFVERGELRVRLLTASVFSANMQIDQFYMMIGSVNTDTSACEISWGTGTATDCSRTRSIAEGITAVPGSAAWQITGLAEYQAGQHAGDNDDDTTNAEFAKAANISFPISIATGTQVTAMHYATKFRSNETTVTWQAQLKNYGTLTGVGNTGTGGGWGNTPGADTNNAATYSYFDTARISELQNDPHMYIDYANNLANMRLQTSASTNVTTGVAGDWSFALMSIRYVESRSTQQLTFALSDSTVGFGDLSPSSVRYATGDTVGASTPVVAHDLVVSTNAAGGYAITVSGTELQSEVATIWSLGSTRTVPTSGTPQFGLSLTSRIGSGQVLSPYNGSTTEFAYGTSTFPAPLANGFGTGLFDVYDARYVAAIGTDTPAGQYSAAVTYIVTGTY